MKIRLNLVLIYVFILFIITNIFAGIMVKITLPINLLWIKKILPDILLILMIGILIIITIKTKIKKNNIIFLIVPSYILFILVIRIDGIKNITQFIFTIRDVWLPFIILFLCNKIRFKNEDYTKLVILLDKIFSFAVVSGFILGVIQIYKGWQWTSLFYTGYNFLGLDSNTGLNISLIEGILRVPSIAGSAVLFGLTNLIALIIFRLNYSEKSVINYKFKFLICVINILLTTSRTTIIMTIVYLFLVEFKRFKKIHKIYTIPMILISCSLIFYEKIIYVINNSHIFSLTSLFERINVVWASSFEGMNLIEYIFGKNLYYVGSGLNAIPEYISEDYSFKYSFIDNVYIFVILSLGIVGLLLILLIFIHIVKDLLNKTNGDIFIGFTLALLVGGIFMNIFQGRFLMYVYFVLYGLLFNNLPKDI